MAPMIVLDLVGIFFMRNNLLSKKIANCNVMELPITLGYKLNYQGCTHP